MTQWWRAAVLAGAVFSAPAAAAANPLDDGFRAPPMEVRPRVWWHWLNGAISEDGIQRDLEWMQRAGIGGVQIFNGALPNNSGVVTPPLVYMTPEWKAAMRKAIHQAIAQGMEVTVASSPGWSETGAPFVAPQDGMKKLVWSQTQIPGGRRFSGTLPAPPDISGPFATVDGHEEKNLHGETVPPLPRHYADTRVIAYRISDGERSLPLPKVTTSGGAVEAAALFDGKLEKAIEIPRPSASKPGWIQYEYAQPVTIRSATVVLEPKKPHIAFSAEIPARLEVSDNGSDFRKVADIAAGAFTQNTSSFPAVTGRVFRIVLQPAAGGLPAAGLDMAPGSLMQPGLPSPVPSKRLIISEMALGAEARVQRFEEKAGFASVPDYRRTRRLAGRPGGRRARPRGESARPATDVHRGRIHRSVRRGGHRIRPPALQCGGAPGAAHRAPTTDSKARCPTPRSPSSSRPPW